MNINTNIQHKFTFDVIIKHYSDLIKNLVVGVGFKDIYFLCSVYGGYNPEVRLCGEIVDDSFTITNHVLIS